jgi:NTE family protein
MKVAKRKAAAAASPSFALALGGGGARGLAHIHVIETLDELGIRPTAIAGSSIGAIMGAAVAAGMSGRDIHEYARQTVAKPREVAARMWQARPGTWREAVRSGLRVSQFDVERVLGAFLPEQLPETFADLKIPLAVATTDYFGHCLHAIRAGQLRSALAASAALPAVFKPVRRDGRLLIDGGIYNPVPFDLLRGTADIVIAIDVVGAPSEGIRSKPSSIDLMYGASQLMMQSIIANKLEHERPDILLRPPVSRFRVLDFLKMDAVMAETVSIRDDLKRAIGEAVEARVRAA